MSASWTFTPSGNLNDFLQRILAPSDCSRLGRCLGSEGVGFSLSAAINTSEFWVTKRSEMSNLTLLIVLCPIVLAGAWTLTSFIRAARFARRNQEHLLSIFEKSSWWMLIFKKDAYGLKADAERKRISLHLGFSFVTLFAILGLIRWIYV